MTGSTARGEATVLTTAGESRWLSDAEFLVVLPGGCDVGRESALLKALAARIETELAGERVFLSVDLSPAPESSFPLLKPNLFTYELRTHGKQLYGERDYLCDIPAFGWKAIPKEDAWRLLSNRMVEWLALQDGQTALPLYAQFYALAKQYLDIVTSLSLLCGAYADRYQSRFLELERIGEWVSASVPGASADVLVRGTRLAMEFKLCPAGPQFAWLRGTGADMRDAMAKAGLGWMYDGLFPLHGAVWEWELHTLSRAPSTGLHGAMARIYGWKYRLRGWGKLAIRPELRRGGGGFFCRAPRLFWRGAPRALVYSCARALLNAEEDRPEASLEYVRGHLPLLFEGPLATREDLIRQCVRNWERYLKRSYL
jgi:hypothetical protein